MLYEYCKQTSASVTRFCPSGLLSEKWCIVTEMCAYYAL